MRVYLFNSRKPFGRRVGVSLDLYQIANQPYKDGEVFYILSLSTPVLGKNKAVIEPVIINEVSLKNLDEEIKKGLTAIGQQIDWGALEADVHPPKVISCEPEPDSKSASFYSNVRLKISDPFPMSGIDKSTIKLKVNGIDVTDRLEITGDLKQSIINWIPKRIFS